jgi:hypothetical protein
LAGPWRPFYAAMAAMSATSAIVQVPAARGFCTNWGSCLLYQAFCLPCCALPQSRIDYGSMGLEPRRAGVESQKHSAGRFKVSALDLDMLYSGMDIPEAALDAAAFVHRCPTT